MSELNKAIEAAVILEAELSEARRRIRVLLEDEHTLMAAYQDRIIVVQVNPHMRKSILEHHRSKQAVKGVVKGVA